MAANMEDTSCSILRTTGFALPLDWVNFARQWIFVTCLCVLDESLAQQLFARQLIADTNRETIFCAVCSLSKELSHIDKLACATEGSWVCSKKALPRLKPHFWLCFTAKFTVTFIVNIWLQKTSAIACTNHYTLSLLQWIKIKTHCSVINYSGSSMLRWFWMTAVLHWNLLANQKSTMSDAFTTFLTLFGTFWRRKCFAQWWTQKD